MCLRIYYEYINVPQSDNTLGLLTLFRVSNNAIFVAN